MLGDGSLGCDVILILVEIAVAMRNAISSLSREKSEIGRAILVCPRKTGP